MSSSNGIREIEATETEVEVESGETAQPPKPSFWQRLLGVFTGLFSRRLTHFTFSATPVGRIAAGLRDRLETFPIPAAEKWFLAELLSLRDARARPQSHGSRKGTESRRLVLDCFLTLPSDRRLVRNSFLRLRSAYLRRQDWISALRMSSMARVFGSPTPRERVADLNVAAKAGISGGYWLGEAGVQFASGDRSANSGRIILEAAAVKGNGISRLILDCQDPK